MTSPRNHTRRGNSIASLIFSSLNDCTSKLPWKCSGSWPLRSWCAAMVYWPFAAAAGSASVESNVPKRLSFTVCSDNNRPCGSVMLTLNSLFSGTA